MSIIYPKDYTSEVSPRVSLTQQEKDDLKAEIKAYVLEPKLYKDVIDHVQVSLYQQNKHVPDEEVAKLVKEVDDEWHPPIMLIEDTPEEPKVLKGN